MSVRDIKMLGRITTIYDKRTAIQFMTLAMNGASSLPWLTSSSEFKLALLHKVLVHLVCHLVKAE